MIEILLTYITICVLYSAYLMIVIYIPVVEELKYIVEERWGKSMSAKIARFNTFYLFIAWSMAIGFAPYLFYYVTRFGVHNCMKSYKETLWLDVRHDALEIIKDEEAGS